ncbi:hypothetical protein EDD18DRAFT_1136631 [Armillaria luteobubalina]|uniref:Secreted protein n=1 Tax=Armillaria luteobubalina TaxID=153913 RepID=A0AA39QJU6_9AGAR|nr:hypothetical protein EDD18DRAFT_1136631 [Armillaria luteobubalina]
MRCAKSPSALFTLGIGIVIVTSAHLQDDGCHGPRRRIRREATNNQSIRDLYHSTYWDMTAQHYFVLEVLSVASKVLDLRSIERLNSTIRTDI